VCLSPTFWHGTPIQLFEAPVPSGSTNEGDLWQAAPGGLKFVLLPMAGLQQAAPPLEVIVNWPTLLSK
jgi:hypothetical protein